MSVITTSVTTNSSLAILKVLKEMLKTGWTLDEENAILWKDSPAAFPVGIKAHTTSSTEYIRPVVKGVDGNPYYSTSTTGVAYSFSNSSTVTYYISVYTSPNGSIAIGFSTSSKVIEPHLLIAKNSNTDSTKPTYIIYGFQASCLLIPGISTIANTPHLNVSYTSQFYAATWSLVNAFDMYTGTALADIYFLAARQESNIPSVLVNGNNKYIKMFMQSSNASVMYMRYV